MREHQSISNVGRAVGPLIALFLLYFANSRAWVVKDRDLLGTPASSDYKMNINMSGRCLKFVIPALCRPQLRKCYLLTSLS
jgi:hypothetical protein